MDSEEIKIIIDINKSIGNINATMKMLNDTTQNLTEAINKQSTTIGLADQKIDFLKETVNKIEETMNEMREQVTTLIRQVDYKESKEYKDKKIEEQVKAQMKQKNSNKPIVKPDEPKKEKGIGQKDLWDGFKLALKNSKWIFFIFLLVILLILVSKNVMKWDDVALLFKQHTVQTIAQDETGE